MPKEHEEAPQGWQRDGLLLYTAQPFTAPDSRRTWCNRITVRVDGHFGYVDRPELDALAERLHAFLVSPPLPILGIQGESPKLAGINPYLPELPEAELAAMLKRHQATVSEWYGEGERRSREATTIEIDRAALLAEVARLRLAAAPTVVGATSQAGEPKLGEPGFNYQPMTLLSWANTELTGCVKLLERLMPLFIKKMGADELADFYSIYHSAASLADTIRPILNKANADAAAHFDSPTPPTT